MRPTITITPSTQTPPINPPLTPANIVSAGPCNDPNCPRCHDWQAKAITLLRDLAAIPEESPGDNFGDFPAQHLLDEHEA